MADALDSGLSLAVGQQLTSPNGKHSLKLQADGNLVLSTNGTAVWASGTDGSGAVRGDMQSDGNFVLYKDGGDAVWATKTGGTAGASLIIGDDRGVSVVGSDGGSLWTSGTAEAVAAPEPAPVPVPTPAPQAAPAPPAAQTYTVVPGDTLSAIAKRFYGDGSQYMRIAHASGISNPDLIRPGQVLTIPA
ncbi:Xanthomonapepsin precursor [Alloactinosynnema sp. L-07]|uniref:LysM peptidoglycan-binding domain-containing protein n=1 Tax=Alloactinosynnema sp. L-07 TaxID=1653480 RepID=UPI00065EFFD9|nr:LysM peptidoglycan-binding domain-containing protein [Alloactinosynnema sp. L-07]CRK60979.1 Xanthomonapepsin precursor [Alloactinosynnema sp. L-07]